MSRRLLIDLIVDILCRLPVKTLFRFKSMSKSFSSLIEDQYFIKSHLNDAVKTNSNSSLIISGFNMSGNIMLYSVDMNLLDAVELDHPFKYCEGGAIVVGSCNGMVALYNRNVGIALWNPSTKKHQILPTLCISFSLNDSYSGGFGYDVASDDYKIMSMRSYPRSECSEVSIYSLKTNSWKRINDIPYHDISSHKGGAFVHNSLHWPVIRAGFWENGREFLIIAFDFERESFREIKLPNTKLNDSSYAISVKVHVLKGCLCTSIYGGDLEYDIWVMKEYGVKESWTRLFSKSINEVSIQDVTSLPYTRTSDKVLLAQQAYGSAFLLYDPEKKDTEAIHIHGKPKKVSYVGICLNSLVSLDIGASPT